jgi:cell shape-determining protein MreC
MEIALVRDWVIVIVGVLEILLLLGLIIIVLVLYSKINKLINGVKETVERIKKTITSPYYKTAAVMFQWIYDKLKIFSGRKNTEAKCKRKSG